MERKQPDLPAGPYRLSKVMIKNLAYYLYQLLRKDRKTSRRFSRRFRRSLEELGPTYVKLGQMLSTRYDLFSKDVIDELSKLQDDVKPVPFEKIKRELRRTYKKPEKYFSKIERNPIASASIAQVHRGYLKNGKRVAVKIRRPNLETTVKWDIRTLMSIANFIDRFFPPVHDDVSEIVREFGNSIEKEMDFVSEGESMLRFNGQFRHDDQVFAPVPYMDLTKENVLVMEYVKGLKLSSLIKGRYNREKYPVNKENLVEVIGNAMLEQIFIHGTLHADPHPGNLIITPDGKLYFIDFGRVNYLDEDLQTFLLEYLISIAKRDSEMLAEVIADNFTLERKETYANDIKLLFSKYYGKTLGDINTGELMVDSFSVSREHKVKLPPQVFLMSRVVLLIEGIGLQLDPDFDYISFLKDYLSRERITSILKKRFRELKKDSVWNMIMLPRRFKNLDKILMGKKRFNIKLPWVEEQMKRFVGAVNALAVAVIMAGLLLSVNNFKYPMIPQTIAILLSFYIVYQLIFNRKK